ncbi:MAG: peptidoglycan editing factor PgeF, partial [Eubacteriales bacterium]
ENISCEHLFGTKKGEIHRDGLILMKQIHSANVRYVTGDDRGVCFEGYDALVADRPDVPIAVKSADCTPILFCDAEAGVIGACHAGWRGTIAGVAAATVREMERHGASAENIQCAIGAAAQFCCYEVREDFRDAVAAARGSEFCGAFVRPYIGAGCECSAAPRQPLHADVPAMNVYILCEAGVRRENIAVCGRCTVCESDVFRSYRVSGEKITMKAYISL